jgi:hypothetical protein
MIQASDVAAPIVGWGAAVMTSLTAALMMLFAAIPRIIGFIVIVFVGWFLADLLARGVVALLRAVRFDHVAERTGIADFLRRTGTRHDAAGMVAAGTRWLVRIVVVLVAFDSLGLSGVSGVLERLLLWLPNLVIALVIVALGGLAARTIGDLARAAAAKSRLGNPAAVANAARIAVLAFTAVIALNELHVAEIVVNTLLIGTVAAVVLAVGLAFGLGGRDLASETLESWRGGARRSPSGLPYRSTDFPGWEDTAGPSEESRRFWEEEGFDRRRGIPDRRIN